MKTKRVYQDICTEHVSRFASQLEALKFCINRLNHSTPASPVVDDVPARIAQRWGF